MNRYSALRPVLLGALIVLGALPFLVAPASAQPVGFELVPRAPQPLGPPLPPGGAFPVQLVLDDGTSEGDVGFNGAAARQFLWWNAFAGTADPLDLEEIWVLFNPGPNMSVGAAVELVVFHDPDSDPSNGADLLATFDTTIQTLDGATFSVYPLAPAVEVPAGGSVYLGVVDRFVVSGVTSPTFPAAVDTSSNLGASFLAAWIGDPPDPPSLPPDSLLTTTTGNWMIRGFGTLAPIPVLAIPTVGEWGLALLVGLLALSGALVMRLRAAGSAGVPPAPALTPGPSGARHASPLHREPPGGRGDARVARSGSETPR